MDAKELKQKQNELDEKIKKIWPHRAGLDGIVDIDEWMKRKIKVLWVLKETRDSSDNEESSFDYRKWVQFSGEKGKNLTWTNIANVSLGISLYAENYLSAEHFSAENLPKLEIEDKSREFYVVCDGDYIYPMSDIAVIDIRKAPLPPDGKGTSNQDEIIAEYEKPEVKQLLLEQVEAINPDVVIIGCQVPHFAEDASKVKLDDFKFTDESKISRAYFDGKKLFVYTHHPCLMGQTKEFTQKYYNSIFEAVKQNFKK